MDKPENSSVLTGVVPVEKPITKNDATKSASLFLARVTSQYLAGQIIAAGIADIVNQAIGFQASTQLVGWAALAIAGLLIFWAQFGYQLAENAGWKWAANLKWPF